jgi:hypothetical protein
VTCKQPIRGCRRSIQILQFRAGAILEKKYLPRDFISGLGNLLIPTDITISGNSTDVWIFQVAGRNLDKEPAVRITLVSFLSKNFWQTAGAATLGQQVILKEYMQKNRN